MKLKCFLQLLFLHILFLYLAKPTWKANYFHTTGLTSTPTDAWMIHEKASNEVFAKPLENDTPILKLADLSCGLKTVENQTQLGRFCPKPSADSYLRKQIF